MLGHVTYFLAGKSLQKAGRQYRLRRGGGGVDSP